MSNEGSPVEGLIADAELFIAALSTSVSAGEAGRYNEASATNESAIEELLNESAAEAPTRGERAMWVTRAAVDAWMAATLVGLELLGRLADATGRHSEDLLGEIRASISREAPPDDAGHPEV